MRYGVLGAGMMGQEHLRNLALLGDADVVAICEPDDGMKARALALAPDAAAVPDLDALLDCGIDALVIATPNFQHADQLDRILGHCDVAVLVEKPIVTARADAARIRDAAGRHPAPVWVGMEYRFMPPLQQFAATLESGVIGRPAMLAIREHRYPFLRKVGNWNRFNRGSGGTMVEKCCHFFDLMRLLLADEAVSVMASAGQAVNHLDERYDGETPDIWDSGYVIVNFASGARAMLDLCMFAEGSLYEQEVCAVGDAGKLECFIPGPDALWREWRRDHPVEPKIVHSPRRPVGPRVTEVPVAAQLLAAGSHQGATFYEHVAFQRAVRGEGEVLVTVADGLKAVVLGMAAQAAAASQRVVRITDDGFGFDGQ